MLTRRTLIASAGGLILPMPTFAQPRRIPFEHARGKIFAPVMVNGVPVQAVLDSGSAFYGLDAAFAAKAGVRADGRRATVRGVQNTLRGRYGAVASIEVGEQRIADARAMVIDYSSLSSTVGRPVEMALGGDFFRRFVVDLDFADHSLALHDRARFVPPADIAPTPLTPKVGVMTAPVVFPGGVTLWAIVDTGSDSPLIVSPAPADRLGLFRGRSSTAPLGGIGGGAVARISTAPRVIVGGVAFDDVPVQGVPRSLGADANLGLGLLGRFHLWLDFAGRRMWMRPGGETTPFRRDLLGFYGEVEGGHIRVTHVAPGSPAAEAGFRPGEIVTAINGLPAPSANQAFRDASAGAALTFTLQGGRTRSLRLARYY